MPSPTSPQGLFQPRGNRRKAAAVPQPQRNDDPQSFDMGVLPSVGGGQGGRAKDTGRRRESRPTVPTAGAVPASLCPRVLRLRPRGNRVPIPLSPPPSPKPGSAGARRGSAALPGGATWCGTRVNDGRPFSGDSRWFYGTVKLPTGSLYIDMTTSLGSCPTHAHPDRPPRTHGGVTGRRERAEGERGPAHASSPGPR